jgi:uncharacterized protein YutE (UPF0331/DUF86 family)
MTSDDVKLQKAAIIERSLRRAFEEFAADPKLENYTHIDALILNLERACQAAIDLAFHVIATERLGLPQTSSDAFRLLERAGHIGTGTARNMIAMTGFRNIAIHEYQALDMTVLRSIVEVRWESFVEFCREMGLRVEPRVPSNHGS